MRWTVIEVLEAMGVDPAEANDPETEYDERISELEATSWPHGGVAPKGRPELSNLREMRRRVLWQRGVYVTAARLVVAIHGAGKMPVPGSNDSTLELALSWADELGIQNGRK